MSVRPLLLQNQAKVLKLESCILQDEAVQMLQDSDDMTEGLKSQVKMAAGLCAIPGACHLVP